MFKISDGFAELKKKKNSCDNCEKVFKTATDLKRHQNIAHRKYLTSEQNFAFYSSYQQSLVPKIFSCIWCDVRFSSQKNLHLHTRAVHEFNCNNCMLEILTFTQFLNHTKTCQLAKENIEYHQRRKLLRLL